MNQLILLALTFVLFEHHVVAAENTSVMGRVMVDELTVRSSPGKTDTNDICVIPNATELPIVGTSPSGNWYQVDASKIPGCKGNSKAWVYGAPYFQLIPETALGFVVNAPKGLIVRAGANSKSAKLCTLDNSDPVHIIGPFNEKSSWQVIDLSDYPDCKAKIGFVSGKYIKETEPDTVEEGFDPASDDSEAEACEACTAGEEHNTETLEGIKLAAQVTAFSQSKAVQDMINSALRSKFRRSHGQCYRAVKKALLRSNIVDHYLGGGSAKNAGHYLEKEGFINLLKQDSWKKVITDPTKAPKGSILVYSGGKHGHIEIKVGEPGDGQVVSDYFAESPRSGSSLRGRGRTLIGVYIKPGVGS